MGNFCLLSDTEYTELIYGPVKPINAPEANSENDEKPDENQVPETEKDTDPFGGYSYNEIVSR